MSNEFELIEKAILQAKESGLEIIRGAQFIWKEGGDQPVACDAIGAVQMMMGSVRPGFPKGWLFETCQYLGVDTYWFWRFTMGFNYSNPLTLIIGKGEKVKVVRDDVSRKAISLAKKYTRS